MADFYEKFLIPKLAEEDIDAIECNYPEYREQDEKLLHSLADKHSLKKTGGSDYHSEDRGDVLGSSGVSENEFFQIKKVIDERA